MRSGLLEHLEKARCGDVVELCGAVGEHHCGYNVAGGARQFAGIVIKTVTRGLRPDAHKERQLKAVHLQFEALYAPQGELHAFPRRNVKDPFDHAVDRRLCRMAL